MTAPLVPSTTTVPVAPTGPVRDRAYWANVLHNAAQVPQADPRYSDARAVIGMALDNIQSAADSASLKDIKDISPGKLGTAAVAFGHGASLGLAGGGPYLDLGRQANPKTAFAADVAGTAALGGVASPLVAGVSPALGGAILGGTLGGARGAIEPLPGMTRGESAALMGVGGAVTGAAFSKFVSEFVPAVRTIGGNIARLLGKSATPQDIAALTESAIRGQLAKLKVQPDIIERAVANWKANGVLNVAAPPEPIATRPGETVTPTAPKPNMESPTFMRRGGSVTQTMSPISGNRTVALNPTAPASQSPVPNQTLADYLNPPSAAGQTMPQMSQQDAARNAFNQAVGMGVPTDAATAAARNVAGFHAEGWDPRQALLLALLLGHKPQP